MSSDWRLRANQRRDFRHTKTPNEVPAAAVANTRKDTKRWCRGKVGVEHTRKCVDYAATKHPGMLGPRGTDAAKMYKGWKILMCTTCGKELASWWPWGSRKKNPPPDWVTA